MTILNKLIPNRKVKIRLIRDDFSSPILGNVWIGREQVLNASTAQRFIELGYAELVVEGESAQPEEKKTPGVDGGTHETVTEKPTLIDALKMLNPDDDAHWTQNGLPDLNVLKELTGHNVKRKEVEEIDAEFTREVAAAAKE